MVELLLSFIFYALIVFFSILIVWCADKIIDKPPKTKKKKIAHKPKISSKIILNALSILSYVLIVSGLIFAFNHQIVASLALCMIGGTLWILLFILGISVSENTITQEQNFVPQEHSPTPPIPESPKPTFPTTPTPTSNNDYPTSRKEFLEQGWKEVSYKQNGNTSSGVYIRSYLEPITQQKHGLFTMAEIGDYYSLSGGYINYNLYHITGTDSSSGKRKTKYIDSLCEETACAEAMAKGLNPPFDIELQPSWEPTDRQLNYARDLNAVLPLNPSQYDVSAIISRIVDGDEDTPPVWLSMLAHENNIHFSRYIGHKALLKQCLAFFEGRCLAELYLWVVYCRLNELKSITLTEYKDTSDLISMCAEQVINNPSAEKSLRGRDEDDFIKPNKSTNIYKASVSVLAEFNLIP